MLKYFKCPDGITRPISECLSKCPRQEGRCLSLPTLTSIGSPRIWKGRPSTTQLLNPTRLEYLQITHDYAIDPFDQAFALLGTRHHQRLDAVAKKIEGLESELLLKGEVSGVLDLLEPLNGGEEYRMIDYKTFGSYACKKHMGTDTKDEYDRFKLALQMNNYRCMAEELGFNIVELKVQITVRDGGTFSAKHNGVDRNLYLLPVEILPDEQVKEYFLTKSFALDKALKTGEAELCDYEGRWGGRRCTGFCSVMEFCPEGRAVNKLKPLGE
jgi:hypothetical protein